MLIKKDFEDRELKSENEIVKRSDIIKSIFLDYGVEYCGIAPVKFGEDIREILQKRADDNHLSGMEESDIDKRLDATLIMEDAKSIIVAAFPYYCGDIDKSNISCYCRGYDYHLVIRGIMNSICEEIQDRFSEKGDCKDYTEDENSINEENTIKTEVFVDNGPLVDRYLAYISGIGFWGLNGSIITDKYGSYVFIGYIVTNLEIETDTPLDKTCLKCGKCIKSCPGNALLEGYDMDAKKCLSYITQKKGELTDEEKNIIKKNKIIFGCDMCQKVCPHNKNIEITNIKEFKNDLIKRLDLEEINQISNKEFKRRYYNRAFSWRGKGIIKRNLEILEED